MKNLIIILVVFFTLFSSFACTPRSSNNITPSAPEKTENLSIMPFGERRYLYTNGTADSLKQISEKKDGISIDKSYVVISGLKNKELQEKLNQDIKDNMEKCLMELESQVKSDSQLSKAAVNYKSSSAYITYNYNNVMFVEYYAGMDLNLNSETITKQVLKSRGYDLNTGNILSLKDLFKEGSNYEKLINDYISLYIIKNNYDDADSNFMSKPFQGIIKDQSFSMDISGVRIILDDKNQEFINRGYPDIITIPLKMAGPELAVFDRYNQNKTSLFEKNGIKKLLPNQTEYKINSLIQESNEKYNIYIEKGEFVNLNPEVKIYLDNLVSNHLDYEGFKARAKAAGNDKYYGNLGHRVNITMNAGGYLSIMVLDSQYENGAAMEKRKSANYNLDKNKIMKLKDIFVENYDYKSAIARVLSTSKEYTQFQGYTFKKADMDALSEDNFSFDEYGVTVNLNITGKEKNQNYFNIPYEKIGYENLVLYK